MPVKQDGTLHAATLRKLQVADDQRVDAPGAQARFVGVGELNGYEASCRVLEVTDQHGQSVNDAVDVPGLAVTLELDDGVQLRVGYDHGYFTDLVGVAPAGLPTSEHTGGHRGLEHDPQAHIHIPPAHQPFQPGQPALAALAGAGQHGEPVSDEEKQRRAEEAQASRDHAAELSRLGGGGSQPATRPEPEASQDEPEQPEQV